MFRICTSATPVCSPIRPTRPRPSASWRSRFEPAIASSKAFAMAYIAACSRTLIGVLMWSSVACGGGGVRGAPADAKPFLGRWDLTLQAPDREYASWLEIGTHESRLTVRMVGRWGHARELPSAEIHNGHIRFVSPKEEEGRATDMV